MFKLWLYCNKVPIIPNSDKAVKNRLRILPYLSTWVDDAPESEEEQMKQRKFKKDPLFENLIPSLAPAFLWILIEYFEKYTSEGLDEPKIIKDYTAEYWEENDVYRQFMNEYIQPAYLPDSKDLDPNSKLTLPEIYREFSFWFRDSFPSIKVPDRASVKYELAQRLGKITRQGWIGVRMVDQYANVSDTAAHI